MALYGLNTYSPYIYGPKQTGTESFVVLQWAPIFLHPFMFMVTVYMRTVTVIKVVYSCVIPCFLTFCSSDQSLLSFKFLIFKYSNNNICITYYLVIL